MRNVYWPVVGLVAVGFLAGVLLPPDTLVGLAFGFGAGAFVGMYYTLDQIRKGS